MNLTFFNDNKSVTTENVNPELAISFMGTLISSPNILDGMGDKLVKCDCKKCKLEFTMFAEIIILEWKIDDIRYEKAFSGYDSYLIQNIIHKLEFPN